MQNPSNIQEVGVPEKQKANFQEHVKNGNTSNFFKLDSPARESD